MLMTAEVMRTDICITGMGSISAFGPIKGPIQQNTIPLRVIKGWPTRGLRRACLVEPFLPSSVVPGLKTRRLDRLSVWALVASSLALQDAQLDLTNVARHRCGVVLGTGFGPQELTGAFCSSVAESGFSKADAIIFPETLDNSPCCHVARINGLTGPNITLVSRGISGEAALIQAASILESGEADIAIAIAGDVLTQALYEYFESTGTLASVCFDDGNIEASGFRNWNGFVPGEGLAAFVMEKGDHYLERQAHAYGWYRSGYTGADLTALPFSWGQNHEIVADLMRKALGPACSEDVRIVVSASNGSPLLDAIESEAIRNVFGASGSPRVVAPKEQLGEFDANAILRLAKALPPLQKCESVGTISQDDGADSGKKDSTVLQGQLTLLLGASTGGGRAALTFVVPQVCSL